MPKTVLQAWTSQHFEMQLSQFHITQNSISLSWRNRQFLSPANTTTRFMQVVMSSPILWSLYYFQS
jgi:hypothetical protein